MYIVTKKGLPKRFELEITDTQPNGFVRKLPVPVTLPGLLVGTGCWIQGQIETQGQRLPFELRG